MTSAGNASGAFVGEAGLRRVADWRQACLGGADMPALLRARVRRLQAERRARAADPAWILQLDESTLEPDLARLAQWQQQAGDRQALLRQRPLFGVPFVVKDNIDIAGLPTTAACPAFARIASAHATVVHKLLEAGAVPVGKSNLDQFATGLVGTRSPHGAPSAVASAQHISGGSSSGSAVLVARGDVPFALGTDTAGSGRVPAAFNGLVGLKPTPGRVSTAGVVPACRSLDCVSVFSHDVDDAALLLALLEGPDEADDYSRFAPGREALPARPRIGVPAAPTLQADDGYPAAWQAALARLEQAGATPVPLDFSLLHEVAALLYQGPWVAERWLAVEPLITQQPEQIEPTVRRVIGAAERLSAADAFRGQYRLQQLKRRAEALWQQVDLLVVPSAPRHPTHAQVAADPLGVNSELGRYTNFVNLLGWSALALPAGHTADGLPFGITAIGPANADAALLRWARSLAAPPAADAAAVAVASAAPSAPSASSAPAASHALPPAPGPATEAVQEIVVVGAHLSGLPLNGQLTERGATLAMATTTAAHYRLHALPGTVPPKPGLRRVAEGGVALAVEVWRLPVVHWASFLALVPSPLGIGRVELADGRWLHGFICEPWALEGAPDVSAHGGWRAYLAAARTAAAATPAPAPALPASAPTQPLVKET